MIGAFFARFAEILRDGGRIWLLAPLIPAIIVLPELAQHVAEIDLGMFDSQERAKALSDDPTRWAFGYVKIAGLLLALLATIRFWGTVDNGSRWWDPRGVVWRQLLVAVVLIALTTVPGTLAEPHIGEDRAGWIDMALALMTLPLLVLLVAGVAGARELTLGHVFRHGWFASLRLLIYTAAVWAPLQWLHGQNHFWAMGASDTAVWSLMVFDSLVVGLIATMAGTAMHHAVRPLASTGKADIAAAD